MHCHGSFSSGNGFIIGMWQCWWNTFGHLSQHISSPPSEQTAHQSSFGSSLFCILSAVNRYRSFMINIKILRLFKFWFKRFIKVVWCHTINGKRIIGGADLWWGCFTTLSLWQNLYTIRVQFCDCRHQIVDGFLARLIDWVTELFRILLNKKKVSMKYLLLRQTKTMITYIICTRTWCFWICRCHCWWYWCWCLALTLRRRLLQCVLRFQWNLEGILIHTAIWVELHCQWILGRLIGCWSFLGE